MPISVTPRIALADAELSFSYILASGPGGQNVNKVASAAQLRFDARNSPSLPEDVRTRLLALAGSRATLNGEIVITARRFRTQERNRQDATDRLVELIREAATRQAARRPTKASFGERQRRLAAKKHRSSIKQLRSTRPE